MTDVLVPPLVPPSARADRCAPQQRIDRRPLPVPALVAARARATVYGLGSVDDGGRVADQEIIRALGWAATTRLDMRVVGGLIVVAATAGGAYALTNRGRVRLPGPVRRSCGIQPGDRVLLAAEPAEGVLVVHPPASLDAMISGRHTAAMAGGAA